MVDNKVTIYSTFISQRLLYVCDIIFNNILNMEYSIVDNIPEHNSSQLTINYSHTESSDLFTIIPDGLIEEKGIINRKIDTGICEGVKCLFYSGEGALPFDIFSAVFYMTSRYEEYLPFIPDKYGRFASKNSIAVKEGFVMFPVVELWVKLLAEKLGVNFPVNTYNKVLTVDIDKAWSYKNNTLVKTVGGFVKDIITLNFINLIKRIMVLSGVAQDPFYTFETIKKFCESVEVVFFVLTGRKGKYDNPTTPQNRNFRKLITMLSEYATIGIHPSYTSNDDISILKKEIDTLSAITGKRITASRQHFLKLSFPNTYRQLLQVGIKKDYTMGWSNTIGFRAGISRSFYFYDLQEERKTDLLIVPFVAMDRTMKDYMKLSPLEAVTELNAIKNTVKTIGGQLCLLFHNDTFSNKGEWAGWGVVPDKVLK